MTDSLKAGLSTGLAVFFLQYLENATGIPLLFAPFGASLCLCYFHPAAPAARPRSLIGGYFICTALGILAASGFSFSPGVLAVTVGAAVMISSAAKALHPPAIGMSIISAKSAALPGSLIGGVTAGVACLVIVSWFFQRMRRVQP